MHCRFFSRRWQRRRCCIALYAIATQQSEDPKWCLDFATRITVFVLLQVKAVKGVVFNAPVSADQAQSLARRQTPRSHVGNKKAGFDDGPPIGIVCRLGHTPELSQMRPHCRRRSQIFSIVSLTKSWRLMRPPARASLGACAPGAVLLASSFKKIWAAAGILL